MQFDPFQEQSIDLVKRGRSVLVSAPTGAGKTVMALAAAMVWASDPSQ